MKKNIYIITISTLLVVLLVSCSQNVTAEEPLAVIPEQTEPTLSIELTESVIAEPTSERSSEPTPASTVVDIAFETPLDLFGKDYNPFADVETPNSYKPFKAEIFISDNMIEYKLSYLTQDSAEEIVSFLSTFSDLTDEEAIAKQITELPNGYLQRDGVLGDKTEFVYWREPIHQDSKEYTMEDGYVVGFEMMLPDEKRMEFNEIIQLNINTEALIYSGFAGIIDAYQPVGVEISVINETGNSSVSSRFYFNLGDDYQTYKDQFSHDEYLGQSTVVYWGEQGVWEVNYGDLDSRYWLNDGDNEIAVNQRLNKNSMNLNEFTAEQSLTLLGFQDYSVDDGKCDFKDKPNGVYLSIMKDIWLESDNEEEKTSFIFIQENDEVGNLLVRYFRPENKYFVQIEKGDLLAKYYYYAVEDKYTEEDGGEDIADLKQIMQQIGNTDADIVMSEPITIFEQYIKDTFEMNSDTLYELPIE